jgi:sec-independent protein translocase protein TatA
MTMPGMWELLVIFGIVLLLFGAKRLPDIASGMGSAINNFKRSMRESKEDPEAPADAGKIDDSATQKVPEQMADKATTTSSATS